MCWHIDTSTTSRVSTDSYPNPVPSSFLYSPFTFFPSPTRRPGWGFFCNCPKAATPSFKFAIDYTATMSNGSWTAFLSWAILASLVRRATFPVILRRLTLMTLVSGLLLVPSLEIRPPTVYQMERGTPTRRVQASYDSPCSLPSHFLPSAPLFMLDCDHSTRTSGRRRCSWLLEWALPL